MMPFLLAEHTRLEQILPLFVRCVGSHEQHRLERPDGYPAHQLFLCRSGGGTFRFDDGRKARLTAGSAMLLREGAAHTYAPDDSGDGWTLGFVAFGGPAAPALLEPMQEFADRAMRPPNFDELWEQLASLWQLIQQNGEQAYWEASKRMYALALTLQEGQTAATYGRRSGKLYPAAGAQPNAALRAAVKLMHDHYDEPLALTNVARAVGYSVQHFHRLFAADYGITPQQYILRLRMQRSLQLLGDHPGILIGKVAQQVGMETSYFIRMFKRTYGATPRQYVQQAR